MTLSRRALMYLIIALQLAIMAFIVASQEMNVAFLGYERQVRIQNYKVSCILALVFMPAGVVLDFLVYPEKVPEFFGLRLLCSTLLFGIWWLVQTQLGAKCYLCLARRSPRSPVFSFR